MSSITGMSSATAGGTATAGYVNPVTSSPAYAGLGQTVARLGLDASIVATIGTSATAAPLYNAAGLLNSIIAAGNDTSAASGTSPAAALTAGTGSSNPGTASAADAATSGIYTAGLTLQSATANVNANWASILKASPAEAATVASDSTIQGILASISVTA